MRLDEGILTYSTVGKFNERHLSDKSPKGRKVKFINENGYEFERKEANDLFIEGETLTVKEIYVGRSSSTVELVEYPNMKFNTVMFADLD